MFETFYFCLKCASWAWQHWKYSKVSWYPGSSGDKSHFGLVRCGQSTVSDFLRKLIAIVFMNDLTAKYIDFITSDKSSTYGDLKKAILAQSAMSRSKKNSIYIWVIPRSLASEWRLASTVAAPMDACHQGSAIGFCKMGRKQLGGPIDCPHLANIIRGWRQTAPDLFKTVFREYSGAPT